VSDEAVRRLTDEALEASELADMRPAYRKLLMRLKQVRPDEFEEASRRYKEDLEPSVASGDVDPIAAWLDYGRWLASRLAEGRALSIDRSGRARPYDPDSDSAHEGLVLHLPDDDRASAVLLATPNDPSPPQQVTLDLLAR
jgi:hypothetical protein